MHRSIFKGTKLLVDMVRNCPFASFYLEVRLNQLKEEAKGGGKGALKVILGKVEEEKTRWWHVCKMWRRSFKGSASVIVQKYASVWMP